MKDLKSLNKQELEDFFNSFDQVLSDVDGVLWLFIEGIPGTEESIKSLKQIGKQVAIISNNTSKNINLYQKQLKSAGFDIEPNEIITPIEALISYLKKQNVTKQIYLMGLTALKEALEDEGFQIAEYPSNEIQNMQDLVRHAFVDWDNIGAVISDADIHLNYLRLQRAASYLKNPDVLFIAGASDKKVAIGSSHTFMGPGYFREILEEISGRKAYSLAKPSTNLNDHVMEKLQIKDKSRVLFVGDSVAEDMVFATKCGYKKLLVLTGLTKQESVENWTDPDEFKPDYYVDSLKSIHDLISQVFVKQT